MKPVDVEKYAQIGNGYTKHIDENGHFVFETEIKISENQEKQQTPEWPF